MLDEMFQRNASKFAIHLEHENPCMYVDFLIRATLIFSLMNALVYVNIDQGRLGRKNKVLSPKSKTLHTCIVFQK